MQCRHAQRVRAADMILNHRSFDACFDFADPAFTAPDTARHVPLRDTVPAAAAFDELSGKLLDQRQGLTTRHFRTLKRHLQVSPAAAQNSNHIAVTVFVVN